MQQPDPHHPRALSSFTYCSFDVAGAAWQFNAEGAVSRLLSEVNDKTLRV